MRKLSREENVTEVTQGVTRIKCRTRHDQLKVTLIYSWIYPEEIIIAISFLMMRNSELASSDVTAFDVNDTQKQAQEKQIFQPVKPYKKRHKESV